MIQRWRTEWKLGEMFSVIPREKTGPKTEEVSLGSLTELNATCQELGISGNLAWVWQCIHDLDQDVLSLSTPSQQLPDVRPRRLQI